MNALQKYKPLNKIAPPSIGLVIANRIIRILPNENSS